MYLNAGLPHGSIFGYCFLLICINDIPDDHKTHPSLYADGIKLLKGPWVLLIRSYTASRATRLDLPLTGVENPNTIKPQYPFI